MDTDDKPLSKHDMLQCPFCGSKSALEIRHSNYPGDRKVLCNYQSGGCGASTTSADNDNEAIKNWNRRPPTR